MLFSLELPCLPNVGKNFLSIALADELGRDKLDPEPESLLHLALGVTLGDHPLLVFLQEVPLLQLKLQIAVFCEVQLQFLQSLVEQFRVLDFLRIAGVVD